MNKTYQIKEANVYIKKITLIITFQESMKQCGSLK